MLQGKKVIIRTFSAGVHYGTLMERLDKQALLANCRRIWSWVDANTLHEMSQTGVGKGSKVSVEIPIILLTEVIEIIPCSDKAIRNLESRGWET